MKFKLSNIIKNPLLLEKAASKKQQKLFGMARAIQTGKLDPSNASDKANNIAKTVSKKGVKDFASTNHKNLPDKIKKEATEHDDKFVKVGYGTIKLLKIHLKLLHNGGIKSAKILDDGDNYTYKNNRSLVISKLDLNKAIKIIKKWISDHYFTEPSPYLDSVIGNVKPSNKSIHLNKENNEKRLHEDTVYSDLLNDKKFNKGTNNVIFYSNRLVKPYEQFFKSAVKLGGISIDRSLDNFDAEEMADTTFKGFIDYLKTNLKTWK